MPNRSRTRQRLAAAAFAVLCAECLVFLFCWYVEQDFTGPHLTAEQIRTVQTGAALPLALIAGNVLIIWRLIKPDGLPFVTWLIRAAAAAELAVLTVPFFTGFPDIGFYSDFSFIGGAFTAFIVTIPYSALRAMETPIPPFPFFSHGVYVAAHLLILILLFLPRRPAFAADANIGAPASPGKKTGSAVETDLARLAETTRGKG